MLHSPKRSGPFTSMSHLGPGKTRTHCGGHIADVIMFPKCVLILPRAQYLCPGHKRCFWKSSFLVSTLCATMLPCFATDGQHRRTQCCRHNVSSFCQGLRELLLDQQVCRCSMLSTSQYVQTMMGLPCMHSNLMFSWVGPMLYPCQSDCCSGLVKGLL